MIPSREYIIKCIPPPTNTEVVYSNMQTAEEIVQCVYDSVNDSMWYVPRYAHIFKRNCGSIDDVCSDIWYFMQENWPYSVKKAETGARQTGRTVRYMIYDPTHLGRKYFDCKHYSTFAMATLKGLGIRTELRLSSYEMLDPTPSHVYVCAFDSRGQQFCIDGTMPAYNQESKAYQRTIVREVA